MEDNNRNAFIDDGVLSKSQVKDPSLSQGWSDFGQLPRNAYTIAVQSAYSIGPHNTIQYNKIQ